VDGMAISAVSMIGGHLTVSASLDDATVGLPTLGLVMHVSAHSHFAERFRVLEGDKAAVQATMIALGFEPLGDDVAAVGEVFDISIRVKVPRIVIGRRAPGDPTWTAALTAIKVQLDAAPPDPTTGQKLTVVHVLSTTQVESEHRELARASMQRGWLYHFCTPSNAVRTNAVVSLDKDIISDGSVCVMTYYDPAGQSGAAAPSVTTPAETYNLTGTDESALEVSLDMAVQQDLETPAQASFTVGKAVVTGTNVGPFVGANGQKFVTGVDSLGPFEVELLAQAATMDSAVEPGAGYGLVDGQTVEWVVDGVAYSYAVAAANYAGNPATATAAQIVADAAIPAPLLAVLTFTAVAGPKVRVTTVHKGSTASVKVGPNTTAAWATALGFPVAGASGSGNVANVAAYTTAEIVGLTRAASKMLYSSAYAPDPQVPGDTAVRLASNLYGTGAKVTIYNTSTGALLTALGLAAAVSPGTGDAVNGATVTAAELFAKLSPLGPDPLVEQVVTDDGPAVKITGTLGVGKVHYLYLVGPLADALGIGGTYFGPGVQNDWASYRWVGSRAGLALDSAPPDAGHLTWHSVSLPGIYGDRTLVESEQTRLNRTQQVNIIVLLNPARGPETADGRLSIPFASGTPAYIDQWIAVRWLALYMARLFKARLDQISDGGDQLGFASEADYTPFALACVEEAEAVAVQSKCLAFVDTTQPTPSKPTGVQIVPKAKLSPTLKGLRIGQVKVWARLGSALHGMLVQIVLST
jgi:hypothetical protein